MCFEIINLLCEIFSDSPECLFAKVGGTKKGRQSGPELILRLLVKS